MIPKNTVLLVVDIQDGFDEPNNGNRNNKEAESNVVRLLEAWRKSARPVMYAQHHSLNPDSPLHPSHPGVAIKEIVKPEHDEPIFIKSVNSAFIGTNLEEVLREKGIDTLIVTGFTINHCVSTTVRMASNLGFKTYVISDATAAWDTVDHKGKTHSAETIHEIALANLHDEFATVLDTESLLAELDG